MFCVRSVVSSIDLGIIESVSADRIDSLAQSEVFSDLSSFDATPLANTVTDNMHTAAAADTEDISFPVFLFLFIIVNLLSSIFLFPAIWVVSGRGVLCERDIISNIMRM